MSELNQLPEWLCEAPPHLSDRWKEIFLHVIASGSYDAPARILVMRYCYLSQELEEIQEAVRLEGTFFVDKHQQPREHPRVKRLNKLGDQQLATFRMLGWDQAPPDGQMPLFGSPRHG